LRNRKRCGPGGIRRFSTCCLRLAPAPRALDVNSKSIEQTAFQNYACLFELRLPGDFRRALEQAVADFFQRVARHVRALVASAGNARDRVIAMPWMLALQLPKHVRLGRYQEILGVRKAADVRDHRLGAADEIRMLADV